MFKTRVWRTEKAAEAKLLSPGGVADCPAHLGAEGTAEQAAQVVGQCL